MKEKLTQAQGIARQALTATAKTKEGEVLNENEKQQTISTYKLSEIEKFKLTGDPCFDNPDDPNCKDPAKALNRLKQKETDIRKIIDVGLDNLIKLFITKKPPPLPPKPATYDYIKCLDKINKIISNASQINSISNLKQKINNLLLNPKIKQSLKNIAFAPDDNSPIKLSKNQFNQLSVNKINVNDFIRIRSDIQSNKKSKSLENECEQKVMSYKFDSSMQDNYLKLVNTYEDLSGSVRIYTRINTFAVMNNNTPVSTYIYSAKKPGSPNVPCAKKIVFLTQYLAQYNKDKTVDDQIKATPKTNDLGINDLSKLIFPSQGQFYGNFMCASNENIYDGGSNVALCETSNNPSIKNTACVFNEDNAHGINQSIKQVLLGYNTVIFGFGYSGAGKTHTLLGSNQEDGLLQLSLKEMVQKYPDENLEILEIKELYGQGSQENQDFPHFMSINKEAIPASGGRYTYKPSYDKVKDYLESDIKGIPNKYRKIKDNSTQRNKLVLTDNTNLDDTIRFLIRKVRLLRKSYGKIKATPNNEESSRGHLIMSFKVGTSGILTIIDLGGIEQPASISYDYTQSGILKTQTKVLSQVLKYTLNNTTFKSKVEEDISKIKNWESNLDNKDNFENYIAKARYIKLISEYFKNATITGNMTGNTVFENAKSKLESIISTTNSEIETASIKTNTEFYGLEQKQVLHDIAFMKVLFRNENKNIYSVIFAMYVRDLVREGYFINETLNHMRAYFKNKKDEYPENTMVDNDLLLKINSDKGVDTMIQGKNYKGPAYNEYNWFYMPVFKGEIPSKFKSRNKTTIESFDYKDCYSKQCSINKDQTGKPNIPDQDPINMISLLRSKESDQDDKPTKYIMMVMIRPDTGMSGKYVAGAYKALEFAEMVASTT